MLFAEVIERAVCEWSSSLNIDEDCRDSSSSFGRFSRSLLSSGVADWRPSSVGFWMFVRRDSESIELSKSDIESLVVGWKSLTSAARIWSNVISVGSPACCLMCCCSVDALEYCRLQIGHLCNDVKKGFSLWTLICVLRLPLVVNARPHKRHRNGRSPVCVR